MKEYLFFSKSDRRNIIVLCSIIILLAMFRMMYSNYKTKKEYQKYSQEILAVQDSTEHNNKEETLSVNENIQEIKPEVQKYEKPIQNKQTSSTKTYTNQQKEYKKLSIEINTVDSAGLLPLYGIGPVFAGRIIRYRERLGGFYYKEQLLEIKYFKEEMLEKIKTNITIDTIHIRKLDINNLEFRDILRHPYIDYEMTKVIVNERSKMHYTSTIDFSSRTGIVDTLLVKYLLLE